MEHFIHEINDYLPINFDDEENELFRSYIKAAYIENLSNKKYQFAYLAFHLLFMSFVYKEFWSMKEFDYQRVRRLCESNRPLGDICKMFDMSIVAEKDAINHAMNILGFHLNRRSEVQNLVETRDKCAHASGIIQYSESDIEYHMKKALEYAKMIHDKTKQHIQKQFCKEVKEYWEGDSFKYKLSVDFTEDLLKKLKLSPKEIEQIFEIDKNSLLSCIEKAKILSYEVSYYMIMLALQSRYIENASSYMLNVPEDSLYTNLRDLLVSLCEINRESVEIELEDELNRAKEKYGVFDLKTLKEGKLAIA